MAYTAPSISAAGLSIPSYNDILARALSKFQTIYGQNAYLGADSADYQLLSVFSLFTADVMQGIQVVYNNRAPGTAIGSGLDALVKLNGMRRKSASFSSCQLVITGSAGAILTNAVARDTSGYLWDLPSPTVIGVGGSVTVTATCETPGAIQAAIGTINTMATANAGWTGVTNSVAAAPGFPFESDATLRARQAVSVALPSQTRFAATMAALAELPNVSRTNGIENPTGATDTYGTPAHSITCVVEGGADADIAQAIFTNRSIGCYTNGGVTVTVTDPSAAQTMPIRFSRPTYVPIYVSIQVHPLTNWTSGVPTLMKQAVTDYLNSLQIGQTVVGSELEYAAMSVRPDPRTPMFSVRALAWGTSASPTGTTDLALSYNQVAQGVLANIVVTTV